MLAAAVYFANSAAFAEPLVVTSIKPIHSLASGVMAGVATPEIIVDGGASPHTFSLRPSKAQSLQQADIVFWVGPQMEAFLQKPISNLGNQATIIQLDTIPGLIKLPFREGATFEGHDHEDEHGHEDEHDHEDEHGHAEDHETEDTDHDETDTHLWLDPENAKIIVREIENTLIQSDPENAEKYISNARQLTERLNLLTAEIHETLAPVKGNPFIVFHDAYHYFENRFAIPAAGSVTISPEVSPGAERISQIKDRVKELEVRCVFSEPQFSPKLMTVITENTNARSAALDPLGSDLENGPDLYFDLMRGLASAMQDCLSDDR